jgi:hypothetical protein
MVIIALFSLKGNCHPYVIGMYGQGRPSPPIKPKTKCEQTTHGRDIEKRKTIPTQITHGTARVHELWPQGPNGNTLKGVALIGSRF